MIHRYITKALGQNRCCSQFSRVKRRQRVCVVDRQGRRLVHCHVKDSDLDRFLKLLKPCRHNLAVCARYMFGWQWVSDTGQTQGLTFILAHTLQLHLTSRQKVFFATSQIKID